MWEGGWCPCGFLVLVTQHAEAERETEREGLLLSIAPATCAGHGMLWSVHFLAAGGSVPHLHPPPQVFEASAAAAAAAVLISYSVPFHVTRLTPCVDLQPRV